MSLFGKFGKKAVKPTWTFEATGVLWRMLPAGERLFVGEDRDKDSKSVSFFCIDAISGAIQWKDITQSEQWWTGIEAVADGKVFLHEYATPDMPGHKKIHCLDLVSGNLLWSNSDLQFILAADGVVIAAREGFETRAFFEIDSATGIVNAGIDVGRVQEARARAPQPAGDLVFPDPIDVHAPIREFSAVLQRRNPGDGVIEYADWYEANGIHVFAFYEVTGTGDGGPRYAQHLEIVRKENRQSVFHETLNRETVAIVPDSFFVLRDMMYYIRERKTLCAIDLGALGRES